MGPTQEPKTPARTKTTVITPSQLPTEARREHEEWLLDEALNETFPASDPIAVTPSAASPRGAHGTAS